MGEIEYENAITRITYRMINVGSLGDCECAVPERISCLQLVSYRILLLPLLYYRHIMSIFIICVLVTQCNL